MLSLLHRWGRYNVSYQSCKFEANLPRLRTRHLRFLSKHVSQQRELCNWPRLLRLTMVDKRFGRRSNHSCRNQTNLSNRNKWLKFVCCCIWSHQYTHCLSRHCRQSRTDAPQNATCSCSPDTADYLGKIQHVHLCYRR